MSDMQNSELLKKIITKIQNKNDNEKASSNINVKPAIVTGVMEDTGKISAYFIDDGNKTEYTFFNKSGEIIEEGDEVKIYYTSNPAKGWVGMRCGITKEDNANGLEPIVAITINSDTDYMISTNAGVEKYEASFEDV